MLCQIYSNSLLAVLIVPIFILGWPLRVGQGVLQGIEASLAKLSPSIAVEVSFMAPGLGPSRPDMAPYVLFR